MKITVIYHSGYGHTAALAKAVADGATEGGATVSLLSVEKLDENRWSEDLDGADAIIFGAPTYMGNVSAPFKKFMDESSARWFEMRWKDKIASGFTNSASQSGDKFNSLITLANFAAQHGMIWVSLGLLPGNNSSQGSPDDLNRLGSYLGAMAQSNADVGPDVAPPPADLKTGAHLGKRVAEITARWLAGKRS